MGSAQPLWAAVVLTALNALKPLHVDDTAYFYVARQMARDPLRPYGFEAFWDQVPVPANAVLAPAGLPAWWAIGMRLLGDQPVLWKLWLFPLVLLLAVALHDLLRRFARGLETPLLWGTLLSPVVLPGFNLMLDVPALALGLGGLALFLRACEREGRAGLVRAAVAGLLLGWAMQTKYSAIVLVPTIAAAAFARRSLGRATVTLAVAVALFAAWEALVAVQHGASHFLLNAGSMHGPETRGAQLRLVAPLITLLGGVGTATALIGMAALGWPRIAAVAAAAAWVASFSWLAFGPRDVVLFDSRSPFLSIAFGPAHAVFAALGLLSLGVWSACAARLLRRDGASGASAVRPAADDWTVVAWLLFEIAGAVVLSPYAAVRRLLGSVIAGTFVTARLAGRAARPRERALVAAACALSAVLGGVLYASDLLEARGIESAVALASRRIDELDPRGERRVWFAGHWGFQFYAERAGMRAVVPGRSRLEPGDWLVVPDAHVYRQAFAVGADWAAPQATLTIDDAWPWTTLSTYYAGISPIAGRHAPRTAVSVYRVTASVVPAPPG